MSQDTNKEQLKQHLTHIQNVFGRNDGERTPSQVYVFELLKKQEAAEVFIRSPKTGAFCETAAKLTEGARMLAKRFIVDIERNITEATKKPDVTK